MSRMPDPVPTERPRLEPELRDPEPTDGVDDTLILWFLSLTPLERLQWAQDMADAVTELRGSREL
jgi:hypothetical protein